MRPRTAFAGLALLSGCASVSELPSITHPEVTVVAVAGAHFEPAADLARLKRSPAAGAAGGGAAGAAGGVAATSASVAISTSLACPYCAGVTLFFAALMTTVTTTHGAIIGTLTAEQGNQMHQAANAATSDSALLRMQTALVQEVSRSLSVKTGRPVPLAAMAPASPDQTPDYRPLRAGDQSAVLEVTLLGVEVLRQMDHGISQTLTDVFMTSTELFTPAITVRGRLISASNNSVLVELSYRHFMPPATAAQWMADGAALFAERLARAGPDAADALLVELLWLHRPHARRGGDVPSYALRPLEPALDDRLWVLEAARGGFSRKHRTSAARIPFSDAGALQPVLKWETFDPGAPASELRYELRVFRAIEKENRFVFVPADEFYRRDGIERTEHRLQQPLEPCGRYFWTVRAVFRLSGAVRASEWSGAYNFNDFQVDPSRWRRGEHKAQVNRQDWLFRPLPGMAPEWFYYPIRAPSADGKSECGN